MDHIKNFHSNANNNQIIYWTYENSRYFVSGDKKVFPRELDLNFHDKQTILTIAANANTIPNL